MKIPDLGSPHSSNPTKNSSSAPSQASSCCSSCFFLEAAKERVISGNIFSPGTCRGEGRWDLPADSRRDPGADGAPWLPTGLRGGAGIGILGALGVFPAGFLLPFHGFHWFSQPGASGQSHRNGNCDPGKFLSLLPHSKSISLMLFPSKENSGKWGLKSPAGIGQSFRIPLSMELFFGGENKSSGSP